MQHYKKRRQTKKLGFEHGTRVTVEFMGVWDTVAALGTPQLPRLDKVVNLFWPHEFYNLEPETCVRNVYHALAVDDERRTFWPEVWNENSFRGGGAIEQVWFSGMHSNVGGGYPRAELAQITLDWMMEKLGEHHSALQQEDSTRGLCLKPSLREEARADANVSGKLHNSRDGLAIFYRYSPRPIEKLCKEKKARIRIHESVLDRLERRTAEYTPGNLPGPGQFQEVARRPSDQPSTSGGGSPSAGDTDPEADEITPAPPGQPDQPAEGVPASDAGSAGDTDPEADEITQGDHSPPGQPDQPAEGAPPASGAELAERYAAVRKKIDGYKSWRIRLYWVFLYSTLALLAGSLWLKWISPPTAGPTATEGTYEDLQLTHFLLHWVLPWVEDGLRYFLPTFFDGLITYLVIEHAWRLAFLVVYAVILYLIRVRLQTVMERREEKARRALLESLGRPT